MINEFASVAGKRKTIERMTRNANLRAEQKEALKKRVRLLKGARVEDIKAKARSLRFRKHFPEMVQWFESRGFRMALITGAFWMGIQELKRKHKELEHFDYIECNHLQIRQGKLTGKVLSNVSGNKEKLLLKLQKKTGATKQNTLVMGDSMSDARMFKHAKIGIAFQPANPRVKKAASHVIESGDLLDVIKIAEKEYA